MSPSRALSLVAETPPSLPWLAADFFVREPGGTRCTLCPHLCLLQDGEVGSCHVRRAVAGGMETATFAVAVAHLDAVERKPLYHFRPGNSALTLAAPGCTFACHYCTNYRLSQYGRSTSAPWKASPVDPESVVAEAARQGAAVALSYTEPILAAELTLALAAAASKTGTALLWKTNGFITPEALARLAPHLQAVNVDLKAADDKRHRALTGAPLAPVLETMRALRRAGVWLEVSTPVIPEFNDDTLPELARLVADLGGDVPWHLLRFTPDYHMRRFRPTPPEALKAGRAAGRAAGLHFVYVERALGPEGRATSCPSCGHRVVQRDVWRTTSTDLEDGCCGRCGQPIPGRW
jgi:pyruvate formate lyase activating enzyme